MPLAGSFILHYTFLIFLFEKGSYVLLIILQIEIIHRINKYYIYSTCVGTSDTNWGSPGKKKYINNKKCLLKSVKFQPLC